jgi:hypothetical protein
MLAVEEGVQVVLFEKVNGTKTCAGGVDPSSPDQRAFAELLAGLLHFRVSPTEYSLDPKDYPAKPLFVVSSENNTLNDLFWLIFDDMEKWQNFSCLHAATNEERLKLVSFMFDGAGRTPSGAGFSSFYLLSPQFIAYVEALIVETPFYYAGSEPKVAGLADTQYKEKYDMYDVYSTAEWAGYLERKAEAWYKRFPIEEEPALRDRDQADDDGAGDAAGGGDAGGSGEGEEGSVAKKPTLRMTMY